MKHKILLVLLLGLMVAFTASAQKVTLQFRQVKLAKVFDAITQQTGLTVAYSRPTVDPDRIVTIEANKEELSQVLTQLMKGTNVTFEIGEKKIYLKEKPTSDVQQSRKVKTISGTIVDDKGEPVIGASIIIEGTSQGTITNIDGEYTLANVPENSMITISFVGYKSLTFAANDKTLANITLKEDSELIDEVVVVGYGVQKKRDVTGAMASVDAAKIASVPVTSASEALQGRASGVLVSQDNWAPGTSPTVLIRGKRSINASNEPLYVVDGVPITGGLREISPSDIASMEVLKDASATAIYGSRGANGVVLITTKQGKDGKTQVDYSGYFGVQTIQNKLELMNGAQYAEYVREAYRNTNSSNKYPTDYPDKTADMANPMFKQDAYVLESLMMAYDENGNYDPSKVRSDNWFDHVTRNGIITDHQISVNGGNAKTATYNKNEGIMKDQSYERYSIRLNLNHEINQWFKFGLQTQYSHSVKERGSGMEGDAYMYRISPLGSLRNEDGTPTQLVASDAQMWNPLMNLEEGAVSAPEKVSRYLGSYYVEVTFPVKGLKFKSNLGLDARTKQDYQFYSSNTSTRQLGTSYAYNGMSKYTMMTLENMLFYNRDFGKDHTLGVTLLQSIQEDKTESNKIGVQDVTSDDLLYNDLASSSIIDKIGSNLTKWTMASFMGRVNYGFKGRYLFTGSVRYDGSSRLAEGHKWVAFPSVALAWRVSEEAFMKKQNFLSNLKLRAGWGKTGNSSIDPYMTRGGLGLSTYVWDNGASEVLGYAPKIMANSELTWETTKQWNVGVDFGFFNNRLSGTVDLYLQHTSDLLLERQIPVVSGFGSVLSNVGETKNKGIEISLSSLNINTKSFQWTTDVMFYANKESIESLYNGKVDDIGNKWFIGHPINVHYDYEKIGIWQNTSEDLAEMEEFNKNGANFKPGDIKIWDNGDKKITEADRKILGSTSPKFIASMVNSISYKGFDFSIFLYASVGAMLNNNIEYLNKPGRANSIVIDYWTPTNPTNAYPRPSVDNASPAYVKSLQYEKADFIRVRNITLGYTLPEKLLKKIRARKIRVYLSANNPFVITGFSGIDPEGARGYTAPSASTWMGGVNLSF
jgi:TonB-linked SusC/RagA family outer membrane protein